MTVYPVADAVGAPVLLAPFGRYRAKPVPILGVVELRRLTEPVAPDAADRTAPGHAGRP